MPWVSSGEKQPIHLRDVNHRTFRWNVALTCWDRGFDMFWPRDLSPGAPVWCLKYINWLYNIYLFQSQCSQRYTEIHSCSKQEELTDCSVHVQIDPTNDNCDLKNHQIYSKSHVTNLPPFSQVHLPAPGLLHPSLLGIFQVAQDVVQKLRAGFPQWHHDFSNETIYVKIH